MKPPRASMAEMTLSKEVKETNRQIEVLQRERALLNAQIEILTQNRDRMEDQITEMVQRRKNSSESRKGKGG